MFENIYTRRPPFLNTARHCPPIFLSLTANLHARLSTEGGHYVLGVGLEHNSVYYPPSFFSSKITVRFGNRLDCSVRKNDQKFLAVRREAPATFVRFLLLSFIFQRNQYP